MHFIDVGIPTDGAPKIERADGGTLLKNMLIGKNFHWQKAIEAVLPGEVILTDDPEFPVLNRLPLETYLECVVGSEMNPDAPAEFLKAHAVISRSWALGKITGQHADSTASVSLNGKINSQCVSMNGKINSPDLIVNWEDTGDHHGFHVCSDDHCQRYQGLQPIREEILEAIRSTAGIVLRSADGHLVDARFSKCCGGKTELFSSCWQDIDPPCLESFDDPWCDLSTLPDAERHKILSSILKDYDLANGGGFRWQTEITPEEVKANLLTKFCGKNGKVKSFIGEVQDGNDKFCGEIGDVVDLEVVKRGPSGRATRLKVRGTERSIEIGKELMIRRLLSPTHLYSSAINISKKNGKFVIKGAGWGHGVGLCQIGAARMALEGHDYREILSFYYPGSILST